MRFWYHRYELRPTPKAAQNLRPREGALLRVEWPDGVGYADCFAWPELGDAELSQQLHSLTGKPLPLAARSLALARADAVARSEKRNLFMGLAVCASHYLVPDFSSLTEAELVDIQAAGFGCLKLKIRAHSRAQREALRDFQASLRGQFRLRLDANSQMSFADCEQLLDRNMDLSQIDFFEDPCPFDPRHWSELNRRLSLAWDQPRHPPAIEVQPTFGVRVLKPAAQDIFVEAERSPGKAICVTSYLDHPVGQCFAAWQAGMLGSTRPLLAGGLQTQGVYEVTVFSEALGPPRQPFAWPQGEGIGFGEILSGLAWKELQV